MVTSRSPYVILSITPASPFCAFIQDFSCKPSEIPRRIGERDEEGKHGKKKGLILMKSSVCILSWLPLGYVLNCEKEKKKVTHNQLKMEVFCVSVLCLVQKMTIYQLSPSWSWFRSGKLL